MIMSYKDLKDYKNVNEDTTDGYYHFGKDLYNFPDAWCYVVWSRRGPGKTYSALWYQIYNKFKIMYMKRTVEDVNTITSGMGASEIDLSPYIPINNDKLTNIQPMSLGNGIGAFYNVLNDNDDISSGRHVSFISALNKIKSIKGIEARTCDWIVMDEFIPQTGEIVRMKEGEQLLDLYMTILRDRVARGMGEIKLVLFANAEDISTPITNELEIVDDMAMLNFSDENNIMYDEKRKILLHHIVPAECPRVTFQDEELGIYQAMKDTRWGMKTFEGKFAHNDFSNVCNCNLKNMKCLCHVIRNKHHIYIYYRETDGYFYMTTSKGGAPVTYDLNLENDQKRFFNEIYFTLKDACVEGRMGFKTYSMYDLLINYKKFFKI